MSPSSIQPPRVQPLNAHPVHAAGEYVLYWMQQCQRSRFNFALEYAIERGNERNLPVVDRPWGPERPIFGKVRYMNAAGLKRKFDMPAYLQFVEQRGWAQ